MIKEVLLFVLAVSAVNAYVEYIKPLPVLNTSTPARYHHPDNVVEENGVAVLDMDSFDNFLNHHEYVVVVFYADWCAKSREFIPAFEQAAENFRTELPPLPFAKIEATRNPDIIKRYAMYEFPHMYFFLNGRPSHYHIYQFNKQTIIDFIRKHRSPHSDPVKDESSLELLKAHHRIVVGYFGEDNEQHHAFQQASQRFEHMLFVHSFDPEFRQSVGSTIVIFKNYEDEERSDYVGDFSPRSIKNFILENRFPTIQPFDDDEAFARIFGSRNPALVLFSDEPLAKFKAFTEVAYGYEETNLVFAHSSFSHGLGHRLSEFVGVRVSHLPSVWALRPVGDNFQLHKHRMKGDITHQNLLEFIQKFKEGKLERHYKTDHVNTNPDSQGGKDIIRELVTSTFEADVMSSFQHVVVLFYYHWCLDTKQFEVTYQIVAEMMRHNPKIVFLKMDMTHNEHPDVEHITDHNDFPIILYYHPKNKENPREYTGLREEKAFLDFLKAQLQFDYTAPKPLEKKRRRQIQLAHGFK